VAVAEGCQQLSQFSIIDHGRVTARGLCAIAVKCPMLSKLSLTTPAVSILVTEAIALCCPRLHSLSLRCGTAAIGARALVRIPMQCAALRKLTIDVAATDQFLALVANGCPLFETLQVDDAELLTIGGVRRFIARCRTLRSLILDNASFAAHHLAMPRCFASVSVTVYQNTAILDTPQPPSSLLPRGVSRARMGGVRARLSWM
jgi:hypothetical protein